MVGHESAECRRMRTKLVEADDEETRQQPQQRQEYQQQSTGTREIGGVWLMGHVAKVKTSNRFQPLPHTETVNEEDEREGEMRTLFEGFLHGSTGMNKVSC